MVARHGRTAWNANGRFQGQSDPPLDQVGEGQARALAAELAPLGPAAVVSSDLRRAAQTADAIAAAAGGLASVLDPDLREVSLGGWEGLTAAEVARAFPEEHRRWEAGEDIARGGGETATAAGRRGARALLRIAAGARAGAPVVVVAHGIVLRAALDTLAAQQLVVVPDLSGGAPHLGNAEWLALELRGAGRSGARPLRPEGSLR